MKSTSFRTITVTEATAVVISSIIGVGVLALPRIAALAAGSGAPLVIVCAALFAFMGLAILAALGKRFPEESMVKYSERIIGKWPARIGTMALIVFFLILTALTAREFGKVVVTSVLQQTPVPATTFIMLLLATIAARNNMSTFGYIHLFYLPFLLIPGFVIVALSLKNAQWINVQPLVGGSLSTFTNGVLTVTALLQVSFVISLIIPAMRHPHKALRATTLGVGIAGLLYLSIVVASVAVFGAEEVKLLHWPTLDLAKTTTIPGEILERLDALFLTVWVVAVFSTLYATYFFVVRTLKELLNLEDHKLFTLFLLPAVFFIAMLPSDIFRLYDLVHIVGKTGLLLTIAYPALLWMIAVLRKKRGEPYEEASSEPSRQ